MAEQAPYGHIMTANYESMHEEDKYVILSLFITEHLEVDENRVQFPLLTPTQPTLAKNNTVADVIRWNRAQALK